jgi:vacuolar-type H+-ATPase subunit I/STV1
MISLLISIGQVGLIIIGWFALKARQENNNNELNSEIFRLKTNSLKQIEYTLQALQKLSNQKKSIEFLTEELKRMDNQISNIEEFNEKLEEYNDLFGDAVEQDIEDLIERLSRAEKFMDKLLENNNVLVKNDSIFDGRISELENKFKINPDYEPAIITDYKTISKIKK